ncbi:VanZ family protein [Sedimentibacter sp. zth1]|uniref:VanZ family protein n=1 Tax=Sedimentibacter sp. zth1 TaxID=2816908 RepID=UPI001A92A0BD|nr:VanZ family protein [Sedimentibacter sp. zth1]QSX06570.1 VanZ family protein [Sedimentibacter sp. zth1]
MGIIKYMLDKLGIYILLAMAFVLCLILLYYLSYKLIYKKLIKGNKKLNFIKTFYIIILISYLLFIIFNTCFKYIPGMHRSMNLVPFMSYRQAMFDFSNIGMSQLIFNIILFIPIGFLLPICNYRFEKWYKTIIIGLSLTILIETTQLIFNGGVFDVDDIINNVLGTILGYSLITTILSVVKKDKRNVGYILNHIWPIITTILIFVGLYTNYNTRDYGNTCRPTLNQNVEDVDFDLNIKLKDLNYEMPMYYPKSYTKKEAFEFVHNIYSYFYKEDFEIEVIDYDTEMIYRVNGGYINFDRLDGTFLFSQYKLHDKNSIVYTCTNSELLNVFEKLDIFIPKELEFEEIENKILFGELKLYKSGNNYINGDIKIEYYKDGAINKINYNLVKYKKGAMKKLISEYDAYIKLINGKFINYVNTEKATNIQILGVEITYIVDTKGFLQPVYKFNCKIDNYNKKIYIEAIK